ncbi:ester cyclase [Nucisporomicrobium flavum]|uniref:ester cyclase n=1 Tax=Nucisporomicrobium flavum TaxID=2785915 RepID=UPI0018F4BE37|nr:nuclear transport factor 2 family protein [Nucisporomicrobium flavum]
MTQEPAAAVVGRYFDMWNTGDTAIADEILHPDWVDHAHPEVTGPAAVKQAVEATRAARPDLHFTVHTVLGDEELVAVVGSVGRSPSGAAAPGHGGPPAAAPGPLVWLVRLVDGLMAEMWTYQQNPPPR